MNKGRVVITGGAGFVGSSLCERFLDSGYAVTAVDNLCTGRMANIEQLLGNPSFAFLQRDVIDPFDVEGPVTAVLHFASPASPFDYQALPIETLKVGSHGTLNALDLAKRKSSRFLLASTSEIYGDPTEHPQRETYLGNVSCIGPRSMYDEAKRYAEAATMAYRRTFGVDTRIIRIFNTYGPRMKHNDGRVVSNFLSQALRGEPMSVFGTGHQTRSFCYVDDLVAGIQLVLERGDDQPYNLGNPNEFTMLELIGAIEQLLGPQQVSYHPLPQDDPTRRKPDISRALDHLGWQPQVALREGLLRTAQGLRLQLGLV